MSWYIAVLKEYATFSGRARRKEYWMFFLFSTIAAVVLSILDMAIGTFDPQSGFGLISLAYFVAVFLPNLAVTVRRLHDAGLSGWWILLVFVPFIGAIALLIMMVLPSNAGENKHGPAPRMTPAEPVKPAAGTEPTEA